MSDENKSLAIREYQNTAKKSNQFPSSSDRSLDMSLYSIQTEIAALQSLFKNNFNGVSAEALKEKMGDILWHITNIATQNKLDLEDVAQFNLAKIEKAYNVSAGASPFGSGTIELLPRVIEIAFLPWHNDKVALVTKLANNEPMQLGDRIDDNSRVDDHYRFHDVIHLSFMAHLNWSPVMRSLLKRKRKNNPSDDRIEDGARAAGIEEAVSAAAFEVMKDHQGRQQVPIELLHFIKKVTRGLEVASTSYERWEESIQDGLKFHKLLKEQNGGIIKVNADSSTKLDFSPRDAWCDKVMDDLNLSQDVDSSMDKIHDADVASSDVILQNQKDSKNGKS